MRPDARPLARHWPAAYGAIREYKAIAAAEEPELAELRELAREMLLGLFVMSAGEAWIGRWEKLLKIAPKATLSIGERRFAVLTRLSERLPFTYEALMGSLTGLCGEGGFAAELDAPAFALRVKVALTAKNSLDEVGKMLRRVCPANLGVSVALQYNQHSALRRSTHSSMRPRSHGGIRNEVV